MLSSFHYFVHSEPRMTGIYFFIRGGTVTIRHVFLSQIKLWVWHDAHELCIGNGFRDKELKVQRWLWLQSQLQND